MRTEDRIDGSAAFYLFILTPLDKMPILVERVEARRSNGWFNSREIAQQTRDIHTMRFQCWASVEDVGPALKQHWANASCLLGGWTKQSESTHLKSARNIVKAAFF